ncbi:MAG: hypothetical protein MR009_02595 [Sutterellaceae bacterium]|nr:hypothetical protein [Sutterellaceae bacterium]MDD7441119.1 hypothetical protein [Sutterellaceae bacterium]MDY2867450.1 hypothetical protein [Mesosutterella sp.]
MDSLTEEAAALVARHIVDGHCSWALARSKAARELGPGVPLPDSSLIETAVREHLAVFSPEHPELLAALRAEALLIMRKLEDAGLGVYLTGAVLNGAATEDSCIRLECFAESGKEAELVLYGLGVAWEPVDPQDTPGLHPLEAAGWLHPIRRGSLLSRLMPGTRAIVVTLEVLPERDRGRNPRKRSPDRFQTAAEASGRVTSEELGRLIRSSRSSAD